MDERARKILATLGLVGGFGLLIWLDTRHSSSSSNPSPQVVWPDSAIIARKREEWTRAGYPPEIQERAVAWAQGWSSGITRRLGLPESEAFKIYPKALDISSRWIEGLYGLFR